MGRIFRCGSHARPVPHDRKPQNTPWINLVCFLIHTQPDPSYVVSVMEYPVATSHDLPDLHPAGPVPGGFSHRVARGSEQIENVFHPKRWVWLSLLICEHSCSGLVLSCSDMKPPSHEIRAFQEKSWHQNGCYSPLLPVALELLSDHTSQCGLRDAFLRLDVLAKSGINHGLVVTAPGCVHLIPEPFQDIAVDPDGDLGFSGLRRNDWATSSPAEIVAVFHLVFTFLHIRTFRIDRPCEPR
jgi:hypothetical protein